VTDAQRQQPDKNFDFNHLGALTSQSWSRSIRSWHDVTIKWCHEHSPSCHVVGVTTITRHRWSHNTDNVVETTTWLLQQCGDDV